MARSRLKWNSTITMLCPHVTGVDSAGLVTSCATMSSSSMKSCSREWTPESAVVTGHWWQIWLMMSITSVILPAETITARQQEWVQQGLLIFRWTSWWSRLFQVPESRLTFRQLGSVATSADALSPLGRVRAKPEPEPYPESLSATMFSVVDGRTGGTDDIVNLWRH